LHSSPNFYHGEIKSPSLPLMQQHMHTHMQEKLILFFVVFIFCVLDFIKIKKGFSDLEKPLTYEFCFPFLTREHTAHHCVLHCYVMEKNVIHGLFDGANIDFFFNTKQILLKINSNSRKIRFQIRFFLA